MIAVNTIALEDTIRKLKLEQDLHTVMLSVFLGSALRAKEGDEISRDGIESAIYLALINSVAVTNVVFQKLVGVRIGAIDPELSKATEAAAKEVSAEAKERGRVSAVAITTTVLALITSWLVAGGTKKELKSLLEGRLKIAAATEVNWAAEMYKLTEARQLILQQVTVQRGREDIILKTSNVGKIWWTVLDSRVRVTHWRVHGLAVGLNEAFKVGSSEMLYPGDVSKGAALKEIIGCRCSLVYGLKKELPA